MAVLRGSFGSEGVSAALNYENEMEKRNSDKLLVSDAAASSIDRFNKPLNKPEVTTFGFQGFPENYMQHPKRPLRHQPSADVSTEVNRYFRKDSATEWRPEPNKARMASPTPREQEQKEPDWLQKRGSPPPAAPQPLEQLHQTISPRYADESQSYRKAPIIRDPLRELTSAERRKKIDEHYQAEEDLAMARQRREKEKFDKIEEQQRIRELQASYRPWGRPGGGAPNRVREMQEDFQPYGLPGGGAPTVKELLAEGYDPYGRPGAGAPVGDNRKQKFTEYQLSKAPEAKYAMPNGMRYGDENRVMDRVRSSMEQRNEMPERREAFGRAATMPLRTSYSDSYGRRFAPDMLRLQEREMEELRRNLNKLEQERLYDSSSKEPRFDQKNDKMARSNDKINEMLEDQAAQLRRMQNEIDRLREEPHLLRPAGMPSRPLIDTRLELKAQDDMSYRPGGRPSFDPNPRAQSGQEYYDDFEPQTERTMRRYNRDSEIFGQSVQRVPDYLNVSPRRHPVGKLYNKASTYQSDFDPPFVRHGRRGLGDPNKEPYEPFNPYGLEGGGAPMVDASGQRRTRIAGSMDILGREDSHSAQARRAHKRTLLNTIGEQAAYDRRKKEEEKAWEKTPYVEVAKTMREKKVGYPKYDRFGIISEHHHLPHMFNPNASQELMKQRQYHDFLTGQVEEKNRNTRLGQLEEKRQAREHFRTHDAFFGRRGGGNIKGEDLRKIKLEKAIHDPQSASRYYNKVRLEDEISPDEILNKFKPRITVNSTHKNLYEYPEGNLKINYEGRAPYAEYGQM